jgi:hypothetical protein
VKAMKFLRKFPWASCALAAGLAALMPAQAQAPARPSAAQAATRAQAAQAQQAAGQPVPQEQLVAQLSPGTAGILLTQADAARTLGGYWRIHWAEDERNFGVLQVTGVNVADNQVVFDGQYSPDGLTTCRATGNWIYNTRAAYSSGGATESIELPNIFRMRLICPGRDTSIEGFVVVNTPLVVVGRATFNSGNQRQTLHIKMRRFASSF